MFTKEYLEKINNKLVGEFRSIYGCDEIALRLKAQGREYNVLTFLDLDPEIGLFAYASEEKIGEEAKAMQERIKKPIAWPIIAIPYHLIEAIEFKPVEPKSNLNIGFKPKDLTN